MPDPVPTRAQYAKAARDIASKKKPKRAVSSGIQLAHRIILSVFVPLACCLFTYAIEYRLDSFRTIDGVRTRYIEWHQGFFYWPVAALFCGVFLWFLWGPKATVMNMEFGQDSGD